MSTEFLYSPKRTSKFVACMVILLGNYEVLIGDGLKLEPL